MTLNWLEEPRGVQGPEFSHGGTDLWDRRGCGTPLKLSVALKALKTK